jgi:hypothetical protein
VARDPVREHDELLIELLAAKRVSRGGDAWLVEGG